MDSLTAEGYRTLDPRGQHLRRTSDRRGGTNRRANPLGTDRLALDREARAIQAELERSGHRDRFELVTRWAVEPLDLLRELRKLKPTVVHFSGHGGQVAQGGARPGGSSYRDVVGQRLPVRLPHLG
jgi:hypothetical protein